MKLQAFLYLLLRDHLTFGAVEKILKDLDRMDDGAITFEDANLDAYTKSLVARLEPGK